jgi:protein-tyrosine kinase
MNAFIDLFPVDPLPQTVGNVLASEIGRAETAEATEFYRAGPIIWDPDSFAEEQICGLVRQVFVPGWPKPARQVVFSAVDAKTDISEMCLQIALTLSAQVEGTTCLVEADGHGHTLEEVIEKRELNLVPTDGPGDLRESSRKLSKQLYLVPRNAFLGENEGGSSGPWLRDRLADLRQSFDYTVIHGPAAGTRTEAALLGSLCDGVVLVVEANSTRRVTAQKVKERLHSANARLLGAVLSQRTFPIPEAIYRRL